MFRFLQVFYGLAIKLKVQKLYLYRLKKDEKDNEKFQEKYKNSIK